MEKGQSSANERDGAGATPAHYAASQGTYDKIEDVFFPQSITFQELVDLNSRLILSLPGVTKDEFLLTTSIPFQAGR